MAQIGKLTRRMEINSSWEALHDLMLHKPEDISSIRPESVHGCDIVRGQKGVAGTSICWNFTLDGKKQCSKQIIEAIDAIDAINHKIVFKVVGGDLLEIYKSFTITFHVEPKGVKLVASWTFEFEKPDASVPDPTLFLDYLSGILKDMDAHASRK